MRVTQSMMTRNYLKNLNTSMSNLAKSNDRINSGLKYRHLSDNVSAGARAMRVREDLNSNQQYIDTINDASNELSSAEGNMMSISELLSQAQRLATKAMNTATMTDKDRETLGTEVKSLQEQILKCVNSQYSDKYLFGGSNNSSSPVTMDANGDVLYNGFNMDDIYKDATDGKYYVPATNPNDPPVLVADNEKKYLDIGLGIKLDNSNKVDPTTAFEMSFSALEVLGFGKSDTGVSKNVVGLLGDLAARISPEPPAVFDPDAIGPAADVLKEQSNFVLLSVTELGTRTNFLENTAERIETDTINLEELHSKLMAAQPADEITQQKMYEFAWNAILKMGSNVIPPSLMDFIR